MSTLRSILSATLSDLRAQLETVAQSGAVVPPSLLNKHNSLVDEFEALLATAPTSLRGNANDPVDLLIIKIDAMIAELKPQL